MRSAGMSPLSRRGASHTGAGPSNTTGDDEVDLDLVKESLMQLNISVRYTRDENIRSIFVVILVVAGVALRDCSARFLVSLSVIASTTMMSSHHEPSLF